MNHEYYLTSIQKLEAWVIKNEYKGYEPFDGLSSYLNNFTLNKELPQRILQQFVRRNPLNLRPLLGIKPDKSSKGMSFLGSGYLKMYEITGLDYYKHNAAFCFDWLVENYSKGYSGYCWGNAFDYVSRAFYLPKDSPTLVWTALIGHHFVEAFKVLNNPKYLDVLKKIGEFILKDIPVIKTEKGNCLSYVTFQRRSNSQCKSSWC